MSLDFMLTDEDGNYVFSRNITHNLGKMANACGIYDILWRPDEHGCFYAEEISERLLNGWVYLVKNPDYCKQFNSPNGWGIYEHFVLFVEDVLKACLRNPRCKIEVSR